MTDKERAVYDKYGWPTLTIDDSLLPVILDLVELYKYRWGKEPDYIVTPNINQTQMIVVLERIVDTDESVLVGYNKEYPLGVKSKRSFINDDTSNRQL